MAEKLVFYPWRYRDFVEVGDPPKCEPWMRALGNQGFKEIARLVLCDYRAPLFELACGSRILEDNDPLIQTFALIVSRAIDCFVENANEKNLFLSTFRQLTDAEFARVNRWLTQVLVGDRRRDLLFIIKLNHSALIYMIFLEYLSDQLQSPVINTLESGVNCFKAVCDAMREHWDELVASDFRFMRDHPEQMWAIIHTLNREVEGNVSVARLCLQNHLTNPQSDFIPCSFLSCFANMEGHVTFAHNDDVYDLFREVILKNRDGSEALALTIDQSIFLIVTNYVNLGDPQNRIRIINDRPLLIALVSLAPKYVKTDDAYKSMIRSLKFEPDHCLCCLLLDHLCLALHRRDRFRGNHLRPIIPQDTFKLLGEMICGCEPINS